ncbi:MAG: 4Fe-4S dicluster domain-containing protein [Vulcanimicrobiota bacterium]
MNIRKSRFDINSESISNSLVKTIIDRSGSDIRLCYQCHKCSSGCPLHFALEDQPSTLIHAITLGLRDLVISSSTPWLCASCKTCSTRCPQGIDVAKVMDVVRKVALQQGVESPCPDVDEFYRALLSSINVTGRSFEPLIIARLKMLTGNITEDLVLGFTMLRKGKLAIFPRISDNIGELRKIIKRCRKEESTGDE